MGKLDPLFTFIELSTHVVAHELDDIAPEGLPRADLLWCDTRKVFRGTCLCLAAFEVEAGEVLKHVGPGFVGLEAGLEHELEVGEKATVTLFAELGDSDFQPVELPLDGMDAAP